MISNYFVRAIIAAAIISTFIGAAFAQSTSTIYKNEFFGGYSHNRVASGLENDDFDDDFNDTIGGRIGANGINASYTRNFTKYIGAKFDFAANGKSETYAFDGDSFDVRYRQQSYLGGIQVKNNLVDGPRVKPFFHALAGVARQSIGVTGDFSDTEGSTSDSFTVADTNFSFALGGGLDVRVNKRVDIRVFQFDYNPIYVRGREIFDTQFDGQLQNNFRFGFGIVIH